jgi:hypothetical protein
MWASDYAKTKAVPRELHIASDLEMICRAHEDGDDFTKPLRVYVDFFAPAALADPLLQALQGHGFEHMFIGAEADPTFVHARKESVWSDDELQRLTLKMLDLAEAYDAAYDGLLIIPPSEDDIP